MKIVLDFRDITYKVLPDKKKVGEKQLVVARIKKRNGRESKRVCQEIISRLQKNRRGFHE